MKVTKLIFIFTLVASSVVAKAQTDFIKYRDYSIPFNKLDTSPLTLPTSWSYPIAGKDYPSRNESLPTKNKAHDYLSSIRCVENVKTVRCGAMSDQHPGAIVFVYRSGGHHNAFFMSTYARLLWSDCFGAPKKGTLEACQYFRQQMAYFDRAKVSPQPHFDTWHINEGLPDAMTQAQIAELYLIENDYPKLARAGIAFDTPLSQGGLAQIYNENEYWYWAAGVDETVRRNSLNVHNKALLVISRMLGNMKSDKHSVSQEEIDKWQTRLDRGIEALLNNVQIFDCDSSCSKGANWSYARTIPTKAEGSGPIGTAEGYHHLNHSTLQRLINRGYDRADKLLDHCSRWKYAQLGANCTRQTE